MIRNVFIIIFLIFNTICDIRTKKLPILGLICFGAAGAAINIFLPEYSFFELLLGMGTGIVLLIISRATSGQMIGEGDGILFIITGLFIGGINNIKLLLWAALLSAIIAGALLMTKKAVGKDRLPFVPFVLIAYIGQGVLGL